MREQNLYLSDILHAIDSIDRFVADMTYEQFAADDKTSSAVVQKLEVIGEAAKGLSDDIRTKSPDISWKEMAGMRDRLIHAYFGIDYSLVWRTIKQRLPLVRERISVLLQNT
ncbi:MAG: DUF86 domain-containing protein [Chitinivibrionales bacterium]|nr:DUF86 domain-containing protein [Chitinivibrionales bacterium]